MNDHVLSLAFEKAKDGLLILKSDKILFCNNAIRRLLSIPDDYQELSIYQFSTNKRNINGKEIDFDKIIFDDFVKGDKSKIEWEFYSPKGYVKFVLINIQHIAAENCNFIVIKDISKRKRYDLMLNARMNVLMNAPNYSLEELYKKTLDELLIITGSRCAVLFTLHEDSYKLECVAGLDECKITRDINDTDIELGQLLEFFESKHKAIINNKVQHNRYYGKDIWLNEVNKEIFVPVYRDSILVAFVGLANKTECYGINDAGVITTFIDITWNIADKKRTEQALIESESRFKNVFEGTSFGMVICNVNGKMLSTNQAFLDILKYKNEELDSLSFSDLFHPDDPMPEEILNQLINGELLNYKAEKILIDRFVDIKWVNISISVHRKAEDTVDALLCLIEDITELKQNIFELIKSEERFKLLSSMASEGICIHDNGVILEANDALAKIFGYESSSELIGTNFIETNLIPPESKEILAKRVVEKRDGIFDVVALKKNGEPVNVEMSGSDFFYNSRPVRIGTVRDITERKTWELALQESERNFREFFDNSIILLFVFDEKGNILQANNHACDTLGYSQAEIQGKNMIDLHMEAEKETLLAEMNLILAGEKNTCSIPFVSKNGASIPVSTHIGFGQWNNKKALFCVGKDLTDLKLSEEKFNKAFNKNALAMIIASKKDFKIIDANEQALNALECGFDELVGDSKLFKELSCSKGQFSKLLEMAELSDVSNIEYRICKKSGKIMISNMSISNITIMDEPYLLISFSDVTDKIETEQALKESESRLSEITENVQEGIILANMQFQYVFVNNTFCRMTGYSKNELLSKKIYELVVSPDDFKMARKLVNEGGTVGRRYVAMRKKNGDQFYINVSAKRIKIADEYFILGTQQDVTQEYIAEQKLLKAYDEISSLKNQLEQENLILREEISKNHSFNEIITQNEPFRKILKQIETVASTDASVLIYGETGTGKELIARAIHEKSKRSKNTLVKLNCAAIPESLIESELFGHEKGAFTGAVQQKIGRFEVANGGTLFLDEIGEMPFDLQSKLLRVLQEGEFERIGGTKTIKVNVRIIAATNRDLNREIDNGNFRLDLYYRLNVFPVDIPPLRRRIDDISILTYHFVNKFNKKLDKNITQIPVRVMKFLENYEWPGNIRELENVIERAMILSRGNVLKLEQSLSYINEREKQRYVPLNQMQKTYIEDVLSYTNWKLSGVNSASELLNLKYSTLVSKMQKLGITKPKK